MATLLVYPENGNGHVYRSEAADSSWASTREAAAGSAISLADYSNAYWYKGFFRLTHLVFLLMLLFLPLFFLLTRLA